MRLLKFFLFISLLLSLFWVSESFSAETEDTTYTYNSHNGNTQISINTKSVQSFRFEFGDTKHTYQITLNGVIITNGYQSYPNGLTLTTNIDPNSNVFKVEAKRSNGNAVNNFSFRIIETALLPDTTPPVITILSNSPPVSGQPTVVNFSITDASQLTSVKWAPDYRDTTFFSTGGTNLGSLRSFSVNQSGYYTIYARDSFGNVSVAQTYVTVVNTDTTPPEINFIQDGLPSAPGEPYLVKFTISDESSVNDVAWSFGRQSLSYFNLGVGNILGDSREFYVTENGDYTVYAKDSAGNESVAHTSVTSIPPKETVPPRIFASPIQPFADKSIYYVDTYSVPDYSILKYMVGSQRPPIVSVSGMNIINKRFIVDTDGVHSFYFGNEDDPPYSETKSLTVLPANHIKNFSSGIPPSFSKYMFSYNESVKLYWDEQIIYYTPIKNRVRATLFMQDAFTGEEFEYELTESPFVFKSPYKNEAEIYSTLRIYDGDIVYDEFYLPALEVSEAELNFGLNQDSFSFLIPHNNRVINSLITTYSFSEPLSFESNLPTDFNVSFTLPGSDKEYFTGDYAGIHHLLSKNTFAGNNRYENTNVSFSFSTNEMDLKKNEPSSLATTATIYLFDPVSKKASTSVNGFYHIYDPDLKVDPSNFTFTWNPTNLPDVSGYELVKNNTQTVCSGNNTTCMYNDLSQDDVFDLFAVKNGRSILVDSVLIDFTQPNEILTTFGDVDFGTIELTPGTAKTISAVSADPVLQFTQNASPKKRYNVMMTLSPFSSPSGSSISSSNFTITNATRYSQFGSAEWNFSFTDNTPTSLLNITSTFIDVNYDHRVVTDPSDFKLVIPADFTALPGEVLTASITYSVTFAP